MANPDFCIIDGFDDYSEAGDQTFDATGFLTRYWTTQFAGDMYLIGALTGNGCALRINTGGGNTTRGVQMTLPGNYARAVGGCIMRSSALTSSNAQSIAFYDGATYQLTINYDLNGHINVRRGATDSGVLLGTSVTAIPFGTVFSLAWDITCHNSAGIIKIWINDVLEATLNLTGQDTCATANNYYNSFSVQNAAQTTGNRNCDFDHLYNGCYLASGGAETPFLFSPVIQTDVGNADDTAQFNAGPTVVGKDFRTTTDTNAPGANFLALVPVTPEVNMTLGSIGLVPAATSATAKCKAVLYSDSAGAPGSLVATGTEVVGLTSGTTANLPFAAGQALTGGTQYWIGYITDTSVLIRQYSSTVTNGQKKANTYTSGAPAGPLSAMTTGQVAWQIWGNCSGATARYAGANKGEPTANEYNTETTVGDKDLFTFPALPFTPSGFGFMAIRVCGLRSDGGARTVDCLVKSGATTSTGSAPGQSPNLSLSYMQSNFFQDPNTGVTWAAAGVNAMKGGYDIAT